MKIRLDKFLFDKNFAKSRNFAQSLIKQNKIKINGNIVNKSNFLIDENDNLEIIEINNYVSRGYFKLLKAIDYFKLDLTGLVVIDIGASTGGFSQLMLEKDVKKIYCVDVGFDQLDEKIKNNKKIINYEKTNFKNITNDFFDEKINFITIDVSFISIKEILNKIISLNLKPIKIVALLKPQFEIGIKIKKTKGFVKKDDLNKVILEFKKFCLQKNIKIINYIESPIKGAKKQNTEFLFLLEI